MAVVIGVLSGTWFAKIAVLDKEVEEVARAGTNFDDHTAPLAAADTWAWSPQVTTPSNTFTYTVPFNSSATATSVTVGNTIAAPADFSTWTATPSQYTPQWIGGCKWSKYVGTHFDTADAQLQVKFTVSGDFQNALKNGLVKSMNLTFHGGVTAAAVRASDLKYCVGNMFYAWFDANTAEMSYPYYNYKSSGASDQTYYDSTLHSGLTRYSASNDNTTQNDWKLHDYSWSPTAQQLVTIGQNGAFYVRFYAFAYNWVSQSDYKVYSGAILAGASASITYISAIPFQAKWGSTGRGTPTITGTPALTSSNGWQQASVKPPDGVQFNFDALAGNKITSLKIATNNASGTNTNAELIPSSFYFYTYKPSSASYTVDGISVYIWRDGSGDLQLMHVYLQGVGITATYYQLTAGCQEVPETYKARFTGSKPATDNPTISAASNNSAVGSLNSGYWQASVLPSVGIVYTFNIIEKYQPLSLKITTNTGGSNSGTNILPSSVVTSEASASSQTVDGATVKVWGVANEDGFYLTMNVKITGGNNGITTFTVEVERDEIRVLYKGKYDAGGGNSTITTNITNSYTGGYYQLSTYSSTGVTYTFDAGDTYNITKLNITTNKTTTAVDIMPVGGVYTSQQVATTKIVDGVSFWLWQTTVPNGSLQKLYVKIQYKNPGITSVTMEAKREALRIATYKAKYDMGTTVGVPTITSTPISTLVNGYYTVDWLVGSGTTFVFDALDTFEIGALKINGTDVLAGTNLSFSTSDTTAVTKYVSGATIAIWKTAVTNGSNQKLNVKTSGGDATVTTFEYVATRVALKLATYKARYDGTIDGAPSISSTPTGAVIGGCWTTPANVVTLGATFAFNAITNYEISSIIINTNSGGENTGVDLLAGTAINSATSVTSSVTKTVAGMKVQIWMTSQPSISVNGATIKPLQYISVKIFSEGDMDASVNTVEVVATRAVVRIISFSSLPTKKNYKAFEEIDLTGCVVGTKEIIDQGQTSFLPINVSNISVLYPLGNSSLRVGDTTVTIRATYGGRSADTSFTGLTVTKAAPTIPTLDDPIFTVKINPLKTKPLSDLDKLLPANFVWSAGQSGIMVSGGANFSSSTIDRQLKYNPDPTNYNDALVTVHIRVVADGYPITYVKNDDVSGIGNWSWANDAYNSGRNPFTTYYAEDAFNLPVASDVVMIGQTFQGWYLSPDFGGDSVTTIPATEMGAKTFYPKFVPSILTVKYRDGLGTPQSSLPFYDQNCTDVFVCESNTYNLPDITLTRDGYTPLGWTVQGTDGAKRGPYAPGPISVTTMSPNIIYGDQMVTCQIYWKSDNQTLPEYYYAITYAGFGVDASNPDGWIWVDAGMGDVNASNTKVAYRSGVAFTLPVASDVKREGYTFSGWYNDAGFSGSAVKTIDASATGAKTFYPKWTANKLTITFNAGGATIGSDFPSNMVVEYAYQKPVVLPDMTVTKTGFTAIGWSASETLSGAGNATYGPFSPGEVFINELSRGIVDRDCTVTCTVYWVEGEPESHDIIYVGFGYDDFGEESWGFVVDGSVNYDFVPDSFARYFSTIKFTLPTASRVYRPGFKLVGWYEDEFFNGSPVTFIPATETKDPITFYPKWKASTLSVSYSSGGSGVKFNNDYKLPPSLKIDFSPERVLMLDDISSDVSRDGYVFAGWVVMEKGNVLYYASGASLPAELMLGDLVKSLLSGDASITCVIAWQDESAKIPEGWEPLDPKGASTSGTIYNADGAKPISLPPNPNDITYTYVWSYYITANGEGTKQKVHESNNTNDYTPEYKSDPTTYVCEIWTGLTASTPSLLGSFTYSLEGKAQSPLPGDPDYDDSKGDQSYPKKKGDAGYSAGMEHYQPSADAGRPAIPGDPSQGPKEDMDKSDASGWIDVTKPVKDAKNSSNPLMHPIIYVVYRAGNTLANLTPRLNPYFRWEDPNKQITSTGSQTFRAFYNTNPGVNADKSFYVTVFVYKGYYNMNDFNITDKELVYNGNDQVPGYKGLPAGVKIAMTTGKQSEIGTGYSVTYIFDSDDLNMNIPSPKTFTFSIVEHKAKEEGVFQKYMMFFIFGGVGLLILILLIVLILHAAKHHVTDEGHVRVSGGDRIAMKGSADKLAKLKEAAMQAINKASASLTDAMQKRQAAKANPSDPSLKAAVKNELVTHTSPYMTAAGKAVDEYLTYKKAHEAMVEETMVKMAGAK